MDGARLSRGLDLDTRRRLGLLRFPWWGLPTENTRDRATAMLPRLLADRLDELGIDFAVVYPTFGLLALHAPDADVREAAARGFNRYLADAFAGLGARLCPVAIVPMQTPAEALAVLDDAVGTLGFRAVMLAGFASRPIPGTDVRGARWLDTFGPESPHDYDAVWRRCEELGVAPTFHSAGMGWDGRSSQQSYVLNHLGNFALAGEATCRALFLAGVPARFPRLRFAFLEGGVAWAAALYAGLVSHFEKRNREAIHRYDPARLDPAELGRLAARWAPPEIAARFADAGHDLHVLSEPDEDPATLDEFAAARVGSALELRDLFTERFHFGCEADDPLNALAFDTRLNPLGARLKAIFGSDIGHWDVPDMRGVLPEAWELVEHGLLDEAAFHDFTFGNAVSLLASANPRFFDGTAVASAVARLRGDLPGAAAPSHASTQGGTP